MKKIALCIIAMSACFHAGSQTPVIRPDLSIPSMIAPAYFGPNAFPVPDMLDGRTSSDLDVELYYDSFLCTMTDDVADDVTMDAFLKVTVPLFSRRVNLVLWMPVVEQFWTTPEISAMRRLSPDAPLSGMDSGDVYVSTDICIMEQDKSGFDMALRAAIKTASANSFSTGRVYDAPGYFFDLSVGRDICRFDRGVFRMAVSSGFLCWQTDNGRQNDAVMYGILASMKSGRLGLEAEYGGYVGWEQCGDAPMTLKTSASWDVGDLSLRLQYQVGVVDWPFHQIRFGIEYRFINSLKTSIK